MPHPRESSVAVIRFAGRQPTSLRIHAQGTDDAAIAVNVGHVLLYTHAATPLLKLRDGLARVSPRELRRGVIPLASHPLTISAELNESDSASVHVMRRPGAAAFVRIQLGQLALDAVDRDAFLCLAQTLQTAGMLAEQHLPGVVEPEPARAVPIRVRGDDGFARVLRAE